LGVDHVDVAVGDQELDLSAFVSSADADVVEFAVVAQGHDALAVDLVLADPEVGGGGRSAGWPGLDSRAVCL
jgi:hypothetical protein